MSKAEFFDFPALTGTQTKAEFLTLHEGMYTQCRERCSTPR